MSDDIEHLDWGGSRGPHPVLNRLLIGATGVAVGALVVAVGPGLLTGSAAQPHPQTKHSGPLMATRTMTKCHPWIATQQSWRCPPHVISDTNAAVADRNIWEYSYHPTLTHHGYGCR